MVRYDVAIVGAGPGGATAAHHLAAAGLRVVVIEKAAPPRYKTCGGGVLQRAARLSGVDMDAVTERRCDVIDLHFLSGRRCFRARWDTPAVHMVMRERFDELLMNRAAAAGATFLPLHPLRRMRPASNAMELQAGEQTLEASIVIGADGASSPTAKLAGFADGRRLIPAVECEIRVEEQIFKRLQNVARFDFDIAPLGYGWVFPKADHLSIGAVTMGRAGQDNLHEIMRRYLEILGIARPLDIQRHGYVIPLSPRKCPLAAGRVLLIGDAAGLADPVTGEGITAAIRSARAAADAIIVENGHAPLAAARYNRWLNRHMLPELKLAGKLSWLLYECPRLRNRLFARHGDKLVEAMARVALGNGSYRSLLKQPAHYLRLLRGVQG